MKGGGKEQRGGWGERGGGGGGRLGDGGNRVGRPETLSSPHGVRECSGKQNGAFLQRPRRSDQHGFPCLEPAFRTKRAAEGRGA